MDYGKSLEIHSHSTASDGQYDPRSLASMMAEHGVDLWALTDHDSIDGCAPAKQASEQAGVGFLPGIEISADLDGESVHVLGYGFDVDIEAFDDFGTQMTEARKRRMGEMIDRMDELGYPVTMADVHRQSGGGNLGRPHLAKALVEAGHAEGIQQAFDRWLHDEGPGYVALARPSVVEAIEMVVDARGLVVLAHPGRYGEIESRLSSWKEAGLWGLEVRHPSHDSEQERRLVGLANRYEFGMTASNDWHGHRPDAVERLGAVVFPRRWREAFFEALEATAWGLKRD